eukprot:3996676-Pyramimonas_sp.AAC.1
MIFSPTPEKRQTRKRPGLLRHCTAVLYTVHCTLYTVHCKSAKHENGPDSCATVPLYESERAAGTRPAGGGHGSCASLPLNLSVRLSGGHPRPRRGTAPVPLYVCSSVPLYHCTSVRLYHCTSVRLYVCTSVRPYRASERAGTVFAPQ